MSIDPSKLSGSKPTKRVKGNKFTTKSGKVIKVNRTISQKAKARKDAKALRKAERNRNLPTNKVKRFVYKLHPKRQFKFWTSKDGLSLAAKILGVSIVVGFFLMISVFSYFRKDLPNLRDVSGDNIGGSIRYFDRTGQTLLWEDYDAVKRVPVESAQISDNLKNATIAIEDREFKNHKGFNLRGITRAAWNNAFGGGGTQGGSTITQQLVKLTTPGFRDEQTVARKIKEVIIAVELERSYSKDEILTGYLNAAPYGTIEYGAEVAARTYFNKSAKDLSIDEAAFLASIPKSPPTYTPHSPAFDQVELEARQDYTIDIMLELGMITSEEHTAAKSADTIAKIVPKAPSKYTGIIAPYFVIAAKDQLELEQGNSYQRGGWKVITTIDLNLQKIAEEEVAAGIAQIKRQKGDTAAFVAEDVETGQVVALVGGADFNNEEYGKFNFATEQLSPGSSFKPYDYLAMIENTENTGAGSVIYDSQGPIEGYSCTNKARPKSGGNCLWDYDFRYPGAVTLRYALGGSRNVPAVKAMLIAGVDKTIETANKLGLYDDEAKTGGYKCYQPGTQKVPENETQCYPSSSIGDGAYLNLDKHVHAYSTISRNGNKIPQTYILKVEDSEGRAISEWQPSAGEQVVRPDSAYIVSDMMADPKASYMARKLHDYKGWDFSLKTGTTNDSRDGWMMGFSTKYSAGVWVGNHDGITEMTGFMETMTQPIWGDFMQRAHDGLDPIARVKPAGIQTLPAYVVRTHIGASSVEPSAATDLFPSWYKQADKSKQEKVKRDKVSGKLSTDCTPLLAIEEIQQTDASSYSSDPFYDLGTDSSSTDDIHKCEDIKPTISINTINKGNGTYTFEFSVGNGTHPLSGDKFQGVINVSIDGQAIPNGSLQVAGPGIYTIDYTSIYDTTKTVRAEVIDSVLYSSVAAVDVNLTTAVGPPADDD